MFFRGLSRISPSASAPSEASVPTGKGTDFMEMDENQVIIDCLHGHHIEMLFSEYMTNEFQKNTSKLICSQCREDKNSKRIILGTGPVTAHEVNEHITEKSYNKLVNQYKELIYKIC